MLGRASAGKSSVVITRARLLYFLTLVNVLVRASARASAPKAPEAFRSRSGREAASDASEQSHGRVGRVS